MPDNRTVKPTRAQLRADRIAAATANGTVAGGRPPVQPAGTTVRVTAPPRRAAPSTAPRAKGTTKPRANRASQALPRTGAEQSVAEALLRLVQESPGAGPRSHGGPAGSRSGGGTPASAQKARAKKAKATRDKIVKTIPPKYKITRGVVRLVAGTTYATWRTAVVAGKGGKIVAGKATARVTNDVKKRKWTGELTGRAFKSSFKCCDESFPSADLLNHHFLTVHADEPRIARKPGEPATLLTATTRRNVGKRLVILAPDHAKPGGRHRVIPRRTHDANRAARLVEKYKDNLIQIGVRAMSDNGPARNVAQSFTAWGNQRPRSVADVSEIALGLERALAAAVDAVELYERVITRQGEGDIRIDPMVVRPGFLRVKEGLQQAQGGLVMHVASFHDAYAPYMNVKTGGISVPQLKGMAGN